MLTSENLDFINTSGGCLKSSLIIKAHFDFAQYDFDYQCFVMLSEVET
jgi:hypothetical protein